MLLVSVVAAVWIENIGLHTGPAVIHRGERERAASALKDAAQELAGVPGIAHLERRLEASSSAARAPHDTAGSEDADLSVVGSSHRGPLGRILLGAVGERLLSGAPSAPSPPVATPRTCRGGWRRSRSPSTAQQSC
jgi:nucleotide-binding universal stress UspA family protein